jgi:hypothetical protein
MNETEIDREALERALELARQEPQRAEQLDEKLKDEPWHAVARFAAYVCQCRNLRLPPWQSPPCWADEDERDPRENFADAQKLLRRMLAAGLSRFEPQPLEALSKAAKK